MNPSGAASPRLNHSALKLVETTLDSLGADLLSLRRPKAR